MSTRSEVPAGGGLPPRSASSGGGVQQATPATSPHRLLRGGGFKRYAPLAGVLLALFIFLLAGSKPGRIFEWRTLDMRFESRGTHPIPSDLVIVFIGDDSIEKIGRWPWPWGYHALLVDILKRHGVREVFFDLLFAERPSQEDEEFFSLAVKSAGNVTLGSYFNDLTPDRRPGYPQRAAMITDPVGALKTAARGIGHCNATPDDDGITRRLPVLASFRGSFYPSAALRVILDRLGVSLKEVQVDPGRAITIPRQGREPLVIPLDRDGLTLINFSGDINSFEAYSYLDILQTDAYPGKAKLDLEKLRGKTVLVGTTFAGNTDLRPTPLSNLYPMICIQGNAINDMLREDFIHRPPPYVNLLLLLALGALTGLLAFILRPIYSLSVTCLFTAIWVGGAFRLFSLHNVWIDIIGPVGVILGNYLVMTTTQYIDNRREKLQYLRNLRYMNDLVETSHDAIVSFDMAGKVLTWNHGAAQIYELPAAEAVGRSWETMVVGSSRERVRRAIEELRATGQAQGLEIRGSRPGGGDFPAGMNLSAVLDPAGALIGISCISQDLTEKKRLEEMLIQSEKMAELGRLGSGIVHEIKNPLTSIMMLAGMIEQAPGLDEKALKYVGIIDQEAHRILRLCQNILSFARPRKPEMKAIELNQILDETVALVEYELKRTKVELRRLLREQGLPALGDDEKLKQVFLNLIINAVHAMSEGGELTIATDLVAELPPVTDGYAWSMVGEPPPGKMALVTLRDGGCGMAQATLEKIFEPFFTTKGEGQGTGLGLYITRNIILEHRGAVRAESLPGQGTVFLIALPAGPMPHHAAEPSHSSGD